MTANLALILGIAVVGGGLIWAAISFFRKTGRQEQQLGDLQSLSDIQAAQAKAAANAPKNKKELIERINKEGI